MLSLFQLVQVHQLSYKRVKELLDDELVVQNVACHMYLSKARLQIFKNERERLKTISVGGFYTPSTVMEVCNLNGASFANYPDFPQPISNHLLVKMNHYVYCVGGIDEWGDLVYNKAWQLNTKNQMMNWKSFAPMNEPRSGMGATDHEGVLVVAGGFDGKNTLHSVECYDNHREKWKPLAFLKHHRSDHALVSCQGSLYAIGGCDGGRVLSSVERLPDLNARWKKCPPMLTSRGWFAAVNCDNAIYAIGGLSGFGLGKTLKTVEKYTPASGHWEYVSEMNTGRSAHAACVMKGKIYVVGGIDANNKVVKTIECYDPALDSWSIVELTEHELFYHSIVAV